MSLRGLKPIEFRSRPTKIIGERFHIYAGRQWVAGKLFLDGCQPAGGLYEWHLADMRRLRRPVGHPQPVWFQPLRPRD